MILIVATVEIKPEHWVDAKALAQQHVEQSRTEPGCISHNWYEHPEADYTLFFYEQWQNQAAIDSHFQESYSKLLAQRISQWASEPPTLKFMPVAEVLERKLG